MTRRLIFPAAAILVLALSTLAGAEVRRNSWPPRTPPRSFLFVFFAPGYPVGATVANVCVRAAHGPAAPEPNVEFEKAFEADVRRISLTRGMPEIEIVGFVCSSNAALIAWSSRSPLVFLRVESAMRALPYVQLVGLGLGGEPDSGPMVGYATANGLGVTDAATDSRRAPSWGAIKVLYR